LAESRVGFLAVRFQPSEVGLPIPSAWHTPDTGVSSDQASVEKLNIIHASEERDILISKHLNFCLLNLGADQSIHVREYLYETRKETFFDLRYYTSIAGANMFQQVVRTEACGEQS
jgi:hypothetical protein